MSTSATDLASESPLLAHVRRVVVGIVAAGAMVVLSGAPAATAGPGKGPPVCVPALAPTNPGAHCALDIWGFVTHGDGTPWLNAVVVDSASNYYYTDANGYYDLEELTPGTYSVYVDCPVGTFGTGVWAEVNDPPSAVPEGNGTRYDFVLSCTAVG